DRASSAAGNDMRPIRGRAAELEAIGSLVKSLGQGRGGVLVVEGPPGIGKSRLTTEAMALAERAGTRTLSGQAFEYQQTVPFFSLFTATLHADPPVGDAEAIRRQGTSADLHYWVVHDLQRAIRVAAATTPLLVLLEDIQWADTGTLLALRALTASHESPVLWVLSTRTGAGGPAVRDLLSELERRGALFLRLSAMPRSGVINMVEDAVRARADVSLLNLAGKAHGNPFLVTELLGGLSEEGRLRISRGCAVATGDSLPRRLGANMRQRLDGLPEDTKEVVQIAAVLPDRFTVALLARMLERRPAVLVSAVDDAVRADLLVEDGDRLRFRHDLLREATRQSLPQSLRRAIERQSATVMLEMGAAPAEVATQLARSADVGDQEAIDALRRAAHFVAKSDKNGAADLSRRALELLPEDSEQRGALLTETVGLLNRSARYREAEALAVAMLSRLSPEEEAQARLRIPAAADALEERVAENRRALQLGSITDATRARHHAWLACNHAVSGLPRDESIITAAIAAAEATGDPESRVICEISLAIFDYVDGYALRALDRIDSLGLPVDGDDPTFAYTLAGIHRTNLLSLIGRFDEAAAVVMQGVETTRREGSDVASVLWALKSAMLHLAAGRLSDARAELEAVPPPLWGAMSEMSMNRRLILAEVAAHTGDRELLQETVVAARAATPTGTTLVNRGAAYVLALTSWQCGDMHETVRWLSCDTGQVFNPLWPNAFDQLILSARVAVAAGDAGLRARVLRSVELLERDSNAVPLFSAVVRHILGILERDAAALVDAASALRITRPLLSACAAEDAGAELAHLGRNARAVDHFNNAFDMYVECGATADARRVARSLRRLGVSRRITHAREKSGWDGLTDAELKVANLIADGATNAAVAERLHLSPHTVKSHVRNAFTKLGINSRAQLAAAMRGPHAAVAIPRPQPKYHPPGDGDPPPPTQK
ncbi:MAG TPA: AAA family ATPase, partial [Mycobacterium sp.]|nr:AAA family ATPase [Mycobacterium sp.]